MTEQPDRQKENDSGILQAFLLLVLPKTDVGRSVAADVREEFQCRARTVGAMAARFWYLREAMAVAVHSVWDRLVGAAGRVRQGTPRGDGLMSRAWADLRFALRALRRTPGFTVVCVFTLAVGIGANTAIFSLANGVLLRPLQYEEPDRLVGVWNTAPGMNIEQLVQSPAIHFTYVDEARVFEDIGLWNLGAVAVTGTEGATQEPAIRMTEGVLPALRVRPAFGRRFSQEDDSPNAPPTILLDWSYWQTHFGGDPDVIGQTLRVDGSVREIIGVLPEGFRLRDARAAIYYP